MGVEQSWYKLHCEKLSKKEAQTPYRSTLIFIEGTLL